jgi:hypothetical protein
MAELQHSEAMADGQHGDAMAELQHSEAMTDGQHGDTMAERMLGQMGGSGMVEGAVRRGHGGRARQRSTTYRPPRGHRSS